MLQVYYFYRRIQNNLKMEDKENQLVSQCQLKFQSVQILEIESKKLICYPSLPDYQQIDLQKTLTLNFSISQIPQQIEAKKLQIFKTSKDQSDLTLKLIPSKETQNLPTLKYLHQNLPLKQPLNNKGKIPIINIQFQKPKSYRIRSKTFRNFCKKQVNIINRYEYEKFLSKTNKNRSRSLNQNNLQNKKYILPLGLNNIKNIGKINIFNIQNNVGLENTDRIYQQRRDQPYKPDKDIGKNNKNQIKFEQSCQEEQKKKPVNFILTKNDHHHRRRYSRIGKLVEKTVNELNINENFDIFSKKYFSPTVGLWI